MAGDFYFGIYIGKHLHIINAFQCVSLFLFGYLCSLHFGSVIIQKHACLCVHVFVCGCVSVCMFVFVCVCVLMCLCVCVRVLTLVSMTFCIDDFEILVSYACKFDVCVCLCVCLCVLFVCLFVCVCVCMCVYVCLRASECVC